jgi:hypothetical protein
MSSTIAVFFFSFQRNVLRVENTMNVKLRSIGTLRENAIDKA